jgi:hypothetical protein
MSSGLFALALLVMWAGTFAATFALLTYGEWISKVSGLRQFRWALTYKGLRTIGALVAVAYLLYLLTSGQGPLRD